MKLALFISSLGTGGAERVLTELANHWSDTGHDVHLYTLSSPRERPFYPLNPKIHLHPLDGMTPQGASLLVKGIFILKRLWRIRHALRSLRPDWTLSFMDVMNVQVILASWGLGQKVVVSERTNPFLNPLPFLYRFLRRVTYPYAESLIVQTETVKSYFDFMAPSALHVIPNALRPLPLKQGKRASKKIIGVGSLFFYKGFDLLITAFADLCKDFTEYTLEIYGDGPEKTRLSALITSQDLDKRVLLKSPYHPIEHKLQEADLFVFPSRFEGFPNALTEALAMGLPCLASTTPGCKDLIEHDKNGLLFESDNAPALETTLRRLLSDTGLQDRLAQEALLIRDRLSPKVIYPLWDKLLPSPSPTHIAK